MRNIPNLQKIKRETQEYKNEQNPFFGQFQFVSFVGKLKVVSLLKLFQYIYQNKFYFWGYQRVDIKNNWVN